MILHIFHWMIYIYLNMVRDLQELFSEMYSICDSNATRGFRLWQRHQVLVTTAHNHPQDFGKALKHVKETDRAGKYSSINHMLYSKSLDKTPFRNIIAHTVHLQ